MDQTVAAETLKEQRLMHWVKAHGDAILRTCFVYLSNLQDAEGAICYMNHSIYSYIHIPT